MANLADISELEVYRFDQKDPITPIELKTQFVQWKLNKPMENSMDGFFSL